MGTSSKSKVAQASTRRRISSKQAPRVVFGVVAASAAEDLTRKLDKLLAWIGKHAGFSMAREIAESYEDLASDVKKGRIDVAWLPPIVYVRLKDDVTPLGTIVRGGSVAYETALIVQKASKIRNVEALRGLRAGWVDRWSAAGFVLPRVNLALLGIDPRTFFRTETFFGSHRAVIRALTEGSCDVAGTYAQVDKKGKVTASAWSEVAGSDVRVLATFGAIPPDVIATRRTLAPGVQTKIWEALLAASKSEEGKKLLSAVFGGEGLQEGLAKSYDSLQRALDMATKRGLFD